MFTARALVVVVLAAAFVRAQEKVALVAKDGQPLTGTLVLPRETPKGGVLLLPARGSNRFAFDPLVQRLRGSGLALLALDPRGHGDSAKDKDGKPVEIGKDAPKGEKSPFALAQQDAEAALEYLTTKGAPAARIAIVAAGCSAATALGLSATAQDRPKALVLLTPDVEETGLSLAAPAARVARRPVLVLSSDEDRPRGAAALKDALTFEEAEFRPVEGTLVRGTAMFGKVPGIEATLAQWIVDALDQPAPLLPGLAPTVVLDGDPTALEASDAAVVKVPLGAAGEALVRVARADQKLYVAFDVPERYLRLNEAVVYVDASGAGPRSPDAQCYRVSFSPKNPARKPVLVQRGGLKGFEDSDDKGAAAMGRTDDKKRWTAEMTLDLDRFCGGPAPRTVRMAFEINGHRADDKRFWPDVATVPTSPRTWAKVLLK